MHAPANNFPLRQHKAAPTCTGDIFPSPAPCFLGLFRAMCIVGAINLLSPAVLQGNGRVIQHSLQSAEGSRHLSACQQGRIGKFALCSKLIDNNLKKIGYLYC